MHKVSLLTRRLKSVFTRDHRRKTVSFFELYRDRPDLAARRIQQEIIFNDKEVTVSDFGCRFNYIEYIRQVTGCKKPLLIRYQDGLVFELR